LPASSIDVGSNVVRDLGHVGPVLTVDVDDKNVPAKIQDVAEAAFGSREMYARPVPISAEDFHGDGGDTDIAIVATNRLLAHGVEPYIFKVIGNLPLVFRNVCLAFLSRRSRFSTMCLGMALSSNRVMRGLGESFALGWRRTFHSLSLLFGSIARLDTGHTQVSVYCGAHAAEVLGYSRNASAPVEQGDHFIGREGNGRHECAGPYFDAAFFKSSEHGVDADAVLAAEICAGKSGEIVLDKVISVDRVDFSGHVYNLETKIGAYIANGIWVHNCRCTTVPVTKSFRELGLDVDEVPAGTRASMNGQVPATQTYEQWLRRQSAEVQDDVLGVTKGALFRRGGLKIRDFINNAGKEYTLDELRKVEAGAFKKANLAA
jgi:hypothetical protein